MRFSDRPRVSDGSQNYTKFRIFMRENSYYIQRILAIAIPFVHLFVCHTGGSVKNGAS